MSAKSETEALMEVTAPAASLPQRLRCFYIAPEAILGLFQVGAKHHFEVTQNGLPADAKVVRAEHDGFRNRLRVVIASETFAPVPDGSLIPEHPDVWLQRLAP